MTQPQRTLYEGTCRGGPLDGIDMASRYPAGVLAVDRPNDRCWLYDYTDGEFRVREAEGRSVDHDKRWTAAEGQDYDVVAVP